MKYADIGRVKALLHLGPAQIGEYRVISEVEILQALEKAVDENAIHVERCVTCMWCVQVRNRGCLCTLPGRPSFYVDRDDYCCGHKRNGG